MAEDSLAVKHLNKLNTIINQSRLNLMMRSFPNPIGIITE